MTAPRARFVGVVADDGTVSDPIVAAEPLPLRDPMRPGTWVQVHVADGVATVTAICAEAGTALAESFALATSHKLDPLLPPAVEAEAEAWARSPGIDDPSLVDLTHLPFVTIDEEQSKDLDQAVAVVPSGDGWTVWYAIADAAHFVRPGMAMFSEALRRGATAYLPGLVIPMLPRILSEGWVSLNPNEDRRAVVFEMRLAGDGCCTGTTLHRARVRSRCKTWFDAVQAFLDGDAPPPGDDPAIADSLRALREVGEVRVELAEERSVVAYRRAEVAVSLPDATSARFVAIADLRNDVERYNEQISVLANVEGARVLLDRSDNPDIQAIYRVHEPPPDQAVARLRAHVDALRRAHGLDATWAWDPDAMPLARWLARLPTDGPAGRIARAIHRQALLANRRSVFQAEPEGHHGVGAPVYGRFTAPMREVVGVFLHKELCEALEWIAPSPRRDDEALRDAVIAASHRARALQRELDREMNRLVLDQMFRDDLARGGVRRSGTVMGLSRDKVHVQLDQPPIDVKVYHRHLEEQLGRRLHTDPSRVALRDGRGTPVVRVGDAVAIEVRGHDPDRDRWRLALHRLPVDA